MNCVLSFENVHKTYAKQLGALSKVALADVSFSLAAGETLGLIGANGAGKSTCIKLLMDFIRPDKGRITVFGKPPQHHQIRRKIGYLPETANFPSNLTVLDMLRFTGRSCSLALQDIDSASEKWLHHLGLWEDRKRPLRDYSKGMQQRANFAIALINDPDLLILDEPMSGLDPIGRVMISELIQKLKTSGKTLLFCSHILEDVDRLVSNILLLHKGKKLFYGTPTELAVKENKPSMAEAFVSMVQKEEPHA